MSRKPDNLAKSNVLKVLNDPAIEKISFGVSTKSFKPQLYHKVAKAIDAGHITVMVDTTAMQELGLGGLYMPTLVVDEHTELYDVLVLGFAELGNTVGRQIETGQIIVHECTHAGMDLLKLPYMTHLDHEAAAYIAGAIYAAEKLIRVDQNPDNFSFQEPIKQAAWEIGKRELQQTRIPSSFYVLLELALRTHHRYKDSIDKSVNNNGVGQQWKTRDALTNKVSMALGKSSRKKH